MRSSTSRRCSLVLAALLLAVGLAGCLASQQTTAELSVSEGSGPFVIYLVIEDGQLTRSNAWWADQAPELDLDVDNQVPEWEAIVLKNDVALARVPLQGTQDTAFLVWRSTQAGTTASPGDAFEVLVVDEASGKTIASYGLEIET